MARAKTIYCPNCGRVACHYDGRQTINPVGRCKKCKKLVIYDIEKDEAILKSIPKRNQASGMQFY